MANVIANWPVWFPHQPLPELPAVFGLDTAGVVAEVHRHGGFSNYVVMP